MDCGHYAPGSSPSYAPPTFFFLKNWRHLHFHHFLACVASVSNRIIAQKLDIFFCSCPSFLDEPREETLATQANHFHDHLPTRNFEKLRDFIRVVWKHQRILFCVKFIRSPRDYWPARHDYSHWRSRQPIQFSRLIGFFLTSQWHFSNISLFTLL